jgi:hypothetical protein
MLGMMAELAKQDLLIFRDKGSGIQEVTLELGLLFDKEKIKEFTKRLDLFRKSTGSDTSTADACQIDKGCLIYETESLRPILKKENRTPIMLLLGNPASHSVKQRMFFSYERNKKEHRFWKVLDHTGILPFEENTVDLNQRNKRRKDILLGVDYNSPFQISLEVFYSMPSPATGDWSGVAGLKRLFGAKAFEKISVCEKKRVEDIIQEHICPNGLVVAFQKDAYSQLKLDENPVYDKKQAIAGNLRNKCQCDGSIALYCLAPTRLMGANSRILEELRTKYAHDSIAQ